MPSQIEPLANPNSAQTTASGSGLSHGKPSPIASTGLHGETERPGQLILNADDWGRDRETTDRTAECIRCTTVSAVSAMVFMQDSERAAELAREIETDAGLHLNFTTAFSLPGCPARLAGRQQDVARYLLRHPLARLVFHPGLASSFEYVVAAQMEEYQRLYGVKPARIDGHHHMHLCANVRWAHLLPQGTLVRRNFSFRAGEKSWLNRYYRGAVDRQLARRHRLVDFLFSLPPLEPASRLQQIFATARQAVVELETHPVNAEEYRFLSGGEMLRQLGDQAIARGFAAGLVPLPLAASA
jgi:predicted glycoside hydrolase/deacetylase ChbG (UPF0249 family)